MTDEEWIETLRATQVNAKYAVALKSIREILRDLDDAWEDAKGTAIASCYIIADKALEADDGTDD